MGRERKDFYQLKKAVGEDPLPAVQLVELEQAGAAAETTGKRKKKKAQKARSTAEAEVEEEAEVEVDAGAETEVGTEGPVGSSKKRTAREEVTSATLMLACCFLVPVLTCVVVH